MSTGVLFTDSLTSHTVYLIPVRAQAAVPGRVPGLFCLAPLVWEWSANVLRTVVSCPPLVPVRQRLPRPRLVDVQGEAQRQVAPLVAGLPAGARIAITAGSRGISDVVPILRGVVAAVRSAGAEPLLVGAMGSHGGGTAEGQRKVLAGLHITEETIGAPIFTGTDVVDLGSTPSGLHAWCDRVAFQSDGILVVNRVKLHTLFSRPFGSGLQKMIGIGLGKVPGAEGIHRRGTAGMAAAIAEVADMALKTGKILGGLAVVENAYDETARLEGVPAARLAERDVTIFDESKDIMPRLPVRAMDVLIIDEMGKNYSGTGMDVNVTGRWRLPGMQDPPYPQIRRLVVLRLSPQSEGNANGVAQADVTTQALVDAIDRQATYLNALTTSFVERVCIPMTMPTEQEAVAAGLITTAREAAECSVVRIKNTLHLEELWLTENLVEEATHDGRCEVVGPAQPLQFDAQGRIEN